MKEYHSSAIRNVAILGHLGSGKTTFAETALYLTKAIDKKGEVDKKSSVCDYTQEEQARQTTLQIAMAPIEYRNHKINLIDIPGSEEFVGELIDVLSVVKGAILVLDATKGIEVGTERCFNELKKRGIPTIVFINKMDKENIKYDAILADLAEKFGKNCHAVSYPLDLTDETLCEAAAGTDEALMEKYFDTFELTEEELIRGLRAAIAQDEFCPVVSGSCQNNDIEKVLNLIVDFLPAPTDLGVCKDANGKEVPCDENAPFAGYVFKTIVDPFVGTISMFKVYSGSIKTGQDVYIPQLDKVVKFPQIFTLMGKTQIQLDAAYAGDILAVSKLAELEIGYTLRDSKAQTLFAVPEYPTAIFFEAVKPKNKQDEDKISSALKKISQEDPTFEFHRNPETNQLLIGGQGVLHLGYAKDKLKNTFKVEVDVEDPKIVYRETIRGRTTGEKGVQGRHKKQSGGAGQFGDVWIKFEPCQENFIFEEQVFGGSVPKNYFPAVEKGLLQALEKGPLAGFPVIGVKAILVDGSYHPVDSNEVSFVLAARLAWQAAVKEVKPTILEPIMEIRIVVKSEYVGDIMSDMSKRRGRILDQQPIDGGMMEVVAEVPESEIIKYATELKTMTQASGTFSRKFLRYDITPEDKIKKIVEEYKQEN